MNEPTDAWSASTLSVREALRESLERGAADASVATVSGVEGSAYRRPGAKRVLAEREAVGAITAGCLEGPVADLAERALADGPLRETFDLTGEDGTWDFGLGCNGVIDVLVEPADESFRPALDRLEAGARAALVTVVGGDRPDASGDGAVSVGARALVGADGSVESAAPRPPIPDDLLSAVRDDARHFAAAGRSDTLEVETDRGTVEVFVDGLAPVPELLVFGHGDDVRPVARLAREAGFRVTVATARGARADAERFPSAHEVVATRPSEVAEAVSRPADTYAVLMSHNFVDDRLALEALLDCEAQRASNRSSSAERSRGKSEISRPSGDDVSRDSADNRAASSGAERPKAREASEASLPAKPRDDGGTPRDTSVPYIGLMGPRKRFDQMREALAGEGRELAGEELDRISTPVGLDLGGGEPVQIALSVVGEVLAVSNGRDGGRLASGDAPIHPRSEVASEPSAESESESS